MRILLTLLATGALISAQSVTAQNCAGGALPTCDYDFSPDPIEGETCGVGAHPGGGAGGGGLQACDFYTMDLPSTGDLEFEAMLDLRFLSLNAIPENFTFLTVVGETSIDLSTHAIDDPFNASPFDHALRFDVGGEDVGVFDSDAPLWSGCALLEVDWVESDRRPGLGVLSVYVWRSTECTYSSSEDLITARMFWAVPKPEAIQAGDVVFNAAGPNHPRGEVKIRPYGGASQ